MTVVTWRQVLSVDLAFSEEGKFFFFEVHVNLAKSKFVIGIVSVISQVFVRCPQ